MNEGQSPIQSAVRFNSQRHGIIWLLQTLTYLSTLLYLRDATFNRRADKLRPPPRDADDKVYADYLQNFIVEVVIVVMVGAVELVDLGNSLHSITDRWSFNMFVESLVLTFIVAISFALLFHKRIQRFIILVQFYKTLKGPTIPQIIANAKKERECYEELLCSL